VCDIQALFEAGQLEDARVLQASLVPANAAVTTTYSVPGLKAALEYEFGYGGKPRMPLQPLTTEERAKLHTILQSVHVEV
jgi:dihydrodipicolinate synthase/N-acetylneuraminate lyase